MKEIIEDPNYKEFDGIYCGTPELTLDPSEYNLAMLARYMKENNIEFSDIPHETLEVFKL
ncbi:MAG: hypothetical protein IJ168_06785 [Eubacterium sp.]|nr:hypothetical protein [Eubacterium sp.]